jgi:hypothetical protein
LIFVLGTHDFDDLEAPRFDKSTLEAHLLAIVFDDKRWENLLSLLEWSAEDRPLAAERKALRDHFAGPDGVPAIPRTDLSLRRIGLALKAGPGGPTLAAAGQRVTLENVLAQLGGAERATTTFLTRHLGLPWTDEVFRLERNLLRFLRAHGTDAQRAKASAALKAEYHEDLEQECWETDLPAERLSMAKAVFETKGEDPGILGQQSTVMEVFEARLEAMSDAQRDALYANVASRPPSIEEIRRQANGATQAWLASALEHRKPIQAGPCGRAAAAIGLYAAHGRPGGPTLEECRVVMLASLAGRGRPYTYDEVMTGCHGLKDRTQALTYADRPGYQDIMSIGGRRDHPIADAFKAAARQIAEHELAKVAALPSDERARSAWYAEAVNRWFTAATGAALA